MVIAPSKTFARRSEKFSQIHVIPQTGCWEFQGSTDRGGYGRLFVAGKERKAHDVFFEEWVGPIPADQFLYLYIQNYRTASAGIAATPRIGSFDPKSGKDLNLSHI